jgi:16S rRNA G966 N2-methylase RsmD
MSAQSTIETMKANHEAAVDAGSGSNGIAALSRAREEMYFRAKDEELIKALSPKTKKPRAKR